MFRDSSRSYIKNRLHKREIGAEQLAQMVRSLRHKHLTSDLQCPCKERDVAVCVPINAILGAQRKADS